MAAVGLSGEDTAPYLHAAVVACQPCNPALSSYSFYSRIPIPPQLAVIPLKRLWSGEMTNAGIRDQVQKFRPGLIALRNDTREKPFQDLLNSEYRLVYQDPDNRLYAHKTIANKPDMAAAKD